MKGTARGEDCYMGWILDIVIVLIVGYVIYSNAKRGFNKVIAFFDKNLKTE